MKKIYNSPVTTIVELKMKASLLQASVGIKNENASSAAMSRGGSWDDED